MREDEWLRVAAPPTSSTRYLNRQIQRFIADNLHDPELSLDQISSALARTKRYLHMSFAAEGTTIAQYIWAARLEKCRSELEKCTDPGKTITDIAYSWGFSSSAHFSRVFKKRFGVAPTAVRRPATEPSTRT
jgi:AraC family transcriptional activator of tynA and feaB